MCAGWIVGAEVEARSPTTMLQRQPRQEMLVARPASEVVHFEGTGVPLGREGAGKRAKTKATVWA